MLRKEDRPALAGEAQTRDLLRREAVRQASTAGTGGSSPEMEATLASISAEVTAEAVERRNRPKQTEHAE